MHGFNFCFWIFLSLCSILAYVNAHYLLYNNTCSTRRLNDYSLLPYIPLYTTSIQADVEIDPP